MALTISRGVVFKAQKVCVYGPEGIGKSTFASQFPEPVFIDTEGSTNLMNVARFPRPSSWTMLLSMIKQVATTPGCCKTLVIDTVDWAEQLCISHICATYDKKGIEDFGYGKGYVFVKEEIGRFLNLLSDVIEAGINVVLTAHTTIRKFELPDECGSFDRYELKLGNKTGGQTSALVKEWADMVLFVNYKQYVVEVDKKKKAQGGSRVMHTQHHPCWDAKNRHDLKPELPFEYVQIAYCIPNHIDGEPKAELNPETKPEPASTASTAAAPVETKPPKEAKPDTPPQTAPPVSAAAVAAAGPLKQKKPDLEGLPKSLADLMAANDVTVGEIQNVVSMKGYYPKDTPLQNYDTSFIDGVLVGAWEQVIAMIQQEREMPF
ncbi:MAG TPA: ATP-binding protein [Methylomusa anaerophila]|uniref:AAA domain-containing protein n=1 Tax=Methylomusa anaerophila TaxID=1930071 RepID=A0A348AIY1_9FIRM|nr:ATP-binding protein [Methylomusa anaerophila]BBB91029.1 hypothetical protein MAMMFC1_01697 [Methylomusa anaerophila]HML88899.1 ATP-binding protein [Methylomusa anaerophila]